MKIVALSAGLLTLAVALSGCTTAGASGGGANIAPIEGSITYGGQPRSKLTKSPVGSTFPHEFIDQFGDRVSETYVIEPDRSLRIIDRHVISESFFD
jgi:hypothetical protein